MLERLLNELGATLAVNHFDVFDSLRPGSSDEELCLLRDTCFAGKEIPDELVTLYKWHNGQEGYLSLNQNDNRTFLPISDVCEFWTFLGDNQEDVLQPWCRSWIPITHNGACDHLVYETHGDHKGELICYWHDWEDRSVKYECLQDWVQDAIDAARMPRSR